MVGIPNEALTAELHRSILLLTISHIALLSLAVRAAWKFAYGNVISPRATTSRPYAKGVPGT